MKKTNYLYVTALVACLSMATETWAGDASRAHRHTHQQTATRTDRSQIRQCFSSVRDEMTQLFQKILTACKPDATTHKIPASCDAARTELEMSRTSIMDKLKTCFDLLVPSVPGSGSTDPVPPVMMPPVQMPPVQTPPSQDPGSTTPPTTPAPMARCEFHGMSIASGESVTAYEAASVAAGGSCKSESRTCDNGVLSGSYQNASCTVEAPVTPPAPAIDGAALYQNNCAMCHGSLAQSERRGVSAEAITGALHRVIAMRNSSNLQALTPDQISAIAKALGGTP